jgi:hypothetical protein
MLTLCNVWRLREALISRQGDSNFDGLKAFENSFTSFMLHFGKELKKGIFKDKLSIENKGLGNLKVISQTSDCFFINLKKL